MDKNGIDKELEELYLEEYNNTLRYLKWRTRDPNRAYDLFHDSILAMHEEHYKHGKPYTHEYFFGIARNIANNFLRKYKTTSSPEQKIEEESENNFRTYHSPEEELIDKEDFQIVIEAIKSLSDREKKCIELRAKGYSYEEVGKELMLKPMTVGAVINRLKKKLKRLYINGKNTKTR